MNMLQRARKGVRVSRFQAAEWPVMHACMVTKQQIPNLLTYSRAAAVPLALGFIVSGCGPMPLFVIFLVASITDFFDGYLARKWNAVSAIGAMLDPLADKLLVALMLLYLVTHSDTPLLPVAVILLRELYIAGLRECLALRSIPLPVSKGGKWKTALQMTAITVLLGSMTLHCAEAWVPGVWLLYGSAILALLSAVEYTRTALKSLR
jgi:CDP-diacylglycerol--glycerol-3-phosphate 3-phosphatidyltransferase